MSNSINLPNHTFSWTGCTQFRKIRLRYMKIGYNINVIRQTACMVVNPITFNNFASLFGCTRGGPQTIRRLRLKDLSKSVGAWCSGSGRDNQSPTVGFLLPQHFSYFLLSCPRRRFISVFVLFVCSRRCCTDELETLHVDWTNVHNKTVDMISWVKQMKNLSQIFLTKFVFIHSGYLNWLSWQWLDLQ